MVAATVLALSLAWAAPAAATTRTWVGGGGDWNDGANWSPAGVPSTADDAIVGSGNPVISSADAAVGSLQLDSALTVTGRTLTVAGAATLSANVLLTGAGLRLNGATTWSAGAVQIVDSGALETAGALQATGSVSVEGYPGSGTPGRRAFRVLPGATATIAGSLTVTSELENDGTLRALAGGTLTQYNQVATPAASSGTFDGAGLLSLSNVLMDAGSSATGSLRFANGPSRIAPGANYAAALTDIRDGGDLDLDTDASTTALRIGNGTRRGTGTLTVASGQSSLAQATFTDSGLTRFTGGQTTITDRVLLDGGGHTLRLGGTTTWSAGAVQILDAGVLEDAGLLKATGAVNVDSFTGGGTAGRRAFHVLAGGTTEVTGTLAVFSELENDGTLHALAGGTLTEYNEVSTPAQSNGAFVADDAGLLSLSNVVIGSGSTASGTGAIRFAYGTSRIVSGSAYAAGITEIRDGGTLDVATDASTAALRISSGTRRGTGTLTVGSGQSSLAGATFKDPGLTAFTGGQTAITDTVALYGGGHTLRLGGTTTWSAGPVQLIDAGRLEDAGLLRVTGPASVDVYDGGGVSGPRAFHILAGGTTEVSAPLTVSSELENDGRLHALAGGTLTQYGEVPTPPESNGAFAADEFGVLSLSNVVMGAGSSASGQLRFASGPSRVLPGANYAAAVTDLRDGGTLAVDTAASTAALRVSGGTRRGTGTLSVGAGRSSLDYATFADPGLTAFTGGQTTISGNVLLDGGGHTLRLGGATTWSGGSFQLVDAGMVENAGTLQVANSVGIGLYSGGGAAGPRGFRNLTGGTLSGDATIYGNVENSGVLAPGALTISGDYEQDPGGTLRVDVAHSRLAVWGTASLAGTLDVSPGPAADTFRVVEAGTLNGTFASISGGPGKALDVAYDATGVTLRVTDTSPPPAVATATPPPAVATPTPPPAPTATPEPTPTPTTGKTVNAAAERGTVTVRLPDGRTVALDETTQIPTGSIVDARAGAVRLAMRGAGGRIETGVFSEGQFRVTQSTGAKPITELTLTEKLDCPKAAGAHAAAGKKRKRRLWGDATGNFRTRGRYGSAVNSGTKWLVEDRCDSTLFRVDRGTILVSRNGSRKTVRVKAGHQYRVRP